MTRFLCLSSLALALLYSTAACFAQTGAQGAGVRAPGQTMPQTRIVQGRNFTYALPAGWRVGEEGNHALVLQASDLSAGVIVYGVSGLGQNLTPPQFAYSAITNNLRLAPDVRISNPTPIQPLPGSIGAAGIHQAHAYYVTLMNENYAQPDLLAGAEADVVKECYKSASYSHNVDKGYSHISLKEVTLMGSGANWPVTGATDYVCAVPESVRAFLPEGRRYVTLGTDGFGRSDTRAALRSYFGVDAASIVRTALGQVGS